MSTMIHRSRATDRVLQTRLERLLGQQDAILHSRRQMLRESLPNATLGVLDAEEHSLEAEEQGVGFSLLALTSHNGRGIEAALRRLAAGSFSRCSDCGGEIPGARLRAQPFATLCLACQDRHDASIQR